MTPLSPFFSTQLAGRASLEDARREAARLAVPPLALHSPPISF